MPLTAANPEATLTLSDGNHHDEEATQGSLTHDSAGVLGKRLFPQQDQEETDATSSGKLSYYHHGLLDGFSIVCD